ncbi:MAG TPA: hypothetical protein VEW28_02780 [Candidatus Kapabacteria bacterium]|nr:hypothetical protein [Candidatus Kapabacteria bacterium]
MKKQQLVVPLARRIGSVLSLGVCIIYFTGCAQNSVSPNSSGGNAMVVAKTAMPAAAVTQDNTFGGKSFAIASAVHSTADSVLVTRARIVLKDLKLHRVGTADSADVDDTAHNRDHDMDRDKDKGDHESDADEGEGDIKVGPFVAEFDSSGEKVISEVTIPPGTYDRIKFEIHKLNENEDTALLNDPLFGDFVNGGHYTVIIDGYSFVGGKKYPFSYKSSLSANVEVAIDSGATFDSSKSYNLTLVFDPKIAFGRPGAKPFDPRDPDNHSAIDELIRRAIRALRVPE